MKNNFQVTLHLKHCGNLLQAAKFLLIGAAKAHFSETQFANDHQN